MKPLIGINADFYRAKKKKVYREVLYEAYVTGVKMGGGVPVILPVFRRRREAVEAVGKIDGLLLSGGDDINPQRFGQKLHPKTNLLEKAKEASDFLLVEEAMKKHIPILAVCYGCQLVNVACGGSILQDIPALIGRKVNHIHNCHRVELREGSFVQKLFRSRSINIYSAHHQAIMSLGKGFKVTAVSPGDGIIEAIENISSKRFILGVQWHPDGMLDAPAQIKLFRALARQAEIRARRV